MTVEFQYKKEKKFKADTNDSRSVSNDLNLKDGLGCHAGKVKWKKLRDHVENQKF